ncbi:MAG: hypothetical protein U0872_06790 [Planctomycetaceae bacterium]
MVAKLDSSLGSSFDSLLAELNHFAKKVNQEDGTLQKFTSDPSLYNNLDNSSQSMAVLLKTWSRFCVIYKEFSDKIARNPEVLGVGGALRPGTGLKDQELLQNQQPKQSQKSVRGQNRQ